MLAIASLHKLGDAGHVGLSQPVQLPLQLLGQPLQQDLLLFTLTLFGFQSFSDCRRQIFSPVWSSPSSRSSDCPLSPPESISSSWLPSLS